MENKDIIISFLILVVIILVGIIFYPFNECETCREEYVNGFGIIESLCDVYYPIVIEYKFENSSFYIDDDYVFHQGFLPEINEEETELIKRCIGFHYLINCTQQGETA